MKPQHENLLLDNFPYFRNAPGSLVKDIAAASVLRTAPGNMTLKTEGEYCEDFVLLLSGQKRVYKQSDAGREITLYEMNPGDICVLNASCILSNTTLPANADSLSDVAMFFISAPEFLKLMGKYEEFRSFVFGRISAGFVAIMSLINEIVFRKMDERLMDYLIEKSENNALATTHQRIADDLGTSREVVSRLLKEFQRQGSIDLSRNLIKVKNLEAEAL